MTSAAADIVIIGGGVHGASLAFQLGKARRGKVVLLEKGYLAGGPTGKSGAMIRPLFVVPAYVRLVLESTRMFEQWSDEVGDINPGFVQNGFLRIAQSLAPGDLGGDLEMMNRLGAPFERVKGEDLNRFHPSARFEGSEQGLFFPKGGYADPKLTTASLAEAARRNGVEIREGVRVTGVKVSQGKIDGVMTDRGAIATRTVINCAGAWSGRLAAMAGVEIPIAVHRQATCLISSREMLQSGRPVWSDGVHRVYFRELGGDLIRAALFGWANDPVDPDANEDEVAPAASRLEPIHDGLARRFETGRAVRYGGFSAMYDMTPDGHPIIGRADGVDGFWHNCGWSGNGFANAPSAGRHIADMILGQRPEIDLSMFAWPRPDGVSRMVY